AHPVGMLVDDEQVERLRQLPEQGQRDMVKIAGTEEVERGPGFQRVRQTALKTAKDAEAASQPQRGAPIGEIEQPRLELPEQPGLGEGRAVEVDYAQVHPCNFP